MFFRSPDGPKGKDPKRIILWVALGVFLILLARELYALFQAAKTRGTF